MTFLLKLLNRLLLGQHSSVNIVAQKSFEQFALDNPQLGKARWIDDYETELDEPIMDFMYERKWNCIEIFATESGSFRKSSKRHHPTMKANLTDERLVGFIYIGFDSLFQLFVGTVLVLTTLIITIISQEIIIPLLGLGIAGFFIATHIYIINLKGARRLIELVNEISEPI